MSRSVQKRLRAQKHPAAVAWDAWLESEASEDVRDPITLGASPDKRQYLQNRLWSAFMAGYNAGSAGNGRTDP